MQSARFNQTSNHLPKRAPAEPLPAVTPPTATEQMAWQLVDRLLLVWHGEGIPAQETWDRLLEVLDSRRHSPVRVMVLENGGGPSATQQLRLTQVIAARSLALPIAVVSDSTRVRFIASTLALFTKRIRTFRLAETDQAIAFLELNERELRTAEAFAAGKRAAAGILAGTG